MGLVLKHLVECVAVPLQGAVDPAGHLSSHQEWFGQMATFGASNADYVVVMLLLPPAAFSVYVMAFRLANALPALVGQALTQDTFVEVGVVAGRRGVDRAVMSTVRRRVVRLSVVGATGGVVAAVVARLILGPEWADLVVVAAVLVLAMPARLRSARPWPWPSLGTAPYGWSRRSCSGSSSRRGPWRSGAGGRKPGARSGAVVGTTAGTALLHGRVAPPWSWRGDAGS